MEERTDPTQQTQHEREVAQVEESRTGGTNAEEDPTVDPGRRPTSDEDLAADQGLEDQESEELG
jgi:hypothetical protein